MGRLFRATGSNGDGKRFLIEGYNGKCRIEIDTDDVDTYAVAKITEKLLHVLNEQWNHAQYEGMEPEPYPDIEDEDEAEKYSDKRYLEGKAILKRLAKEFAE